MSQEDTQAAFDKIAPSYNHLFPALPTAYLELIQEATAINAEDRIIDVGCGTGRLTIPLSKICKNVEGLDVSESMLAIARSAETTGNVVWHHCPVESFDLGNEAFNLIISFESFHLFHVRDELVYRFARALKPGGFLAVGWMHYEWERVLEKPVIEAFASNGVEWGEWGYQACRDFTGLVTGCGLLAYVVERSIQVEARSSIADVVDLLLSVEKVLSVAPATRERVRQRLLRNVADVCPSGLFEGPASYHLAYSQKP